MLLLHVSSAIAKFVECSREEIEQANAQPKSDFFPYLYRIHVKITIMVDVIFFGSSVGSHRISNEVRRNKLSSHAAFFFSDIITRIEF